jgi:hypothetical protein
LPVKIPQTRAGQRRIAAVGIFTNRKMGDVFSFFKQLLSYRPDSFAYSIKISIAGRSVKDFMLGDKAFTIAAVGVFTNRKMGDVFSFFKQLLSYRQDSFANTIKIINYKNSLTIDAQ